MPWDHFTAMKIPSLPWGNEDPVQPKQNPKPQCHLQKLKNMCTCLEGGGNWIPRDFLGVWIMFYFLNRSLLYSDTSSLPVRTMPNELHIQAYPRPESFRVSHPETNTGRQSAPPGPPSPCGDEEGRRGLSEAAWSHILAPLRPSGVSSHPGLGCSPPAPCPCGAGGGCTGCGVCSATPFSIRSWSSTWETP